MARTRVTFDLPLEFSEKEVERLMEELPGAAYVVMAAVTEGRPEKPSFDRDFLHITQHVHVSSPGEACRYCYKKLSTDELS